MSRKVSEEALRELEGMVRAIAIRTRSRMGVRVDLEDLFQIGMVGLLEAAERYDPDSGVTLATYAYTRVYGSILDGIGTITGLKRTQVRRYKRLVAAVEATASIDEASATSAREEYLASAIDGVLFSGMMKEFAEEEHQAEEEGESPFSRSPERSVGGVQLRQLIATVIDDLADEERQILRAHYFDDRPLSVIGEELGVSRSWACRIHARALKNARQLLEKQHGVGLADLLDATS